MESFLLEVEKFIQSSERFWVVIIACALILTAFLFNLTLAVFRSGYNTKKRLSFLVFSLSVVALENAFLVKKDSEYLIFATLFLALLSFIPLLLIRVKTGKKKQVELARYIDDRLKQANENCLQEKPPITIKCQPIEQKTVYKEDVNFSHVKNVIERLNYYTLSPFDRKQVNDLSCLLIEAEKTGITKELKEKINDGLGALLKIMSKYGV